MRLLILCASLWSGAALAQSAPDALFDAITAKDIAAVQVALEQSVTADMDPSTEPDRQRALFKVFKNTHPAVDALTADWLAAEPQNPYALTARGWYLSGLSFALRGGRFAANTRPEALRSFRDLQLQAATLFNAAIALNPDLLAASDGVLATAASTQRLDAIPAEIDRVMMRHPNPYSLRKAMQSLAPQWGGRVEQIDLLCDRYAPMITVPPGYTPKICWIDSVYAGGVSQHDVRQAAYEALAETDNPVLDYARLEDVKAMNRTAGERLHFLDALRAKGPLDAEAAYAYDVAFAQVNDPNGMMAPIEYLRALPQAIKSAQHQSDLDPLSGRPLTDLFNLARPVSERQASSVDPADLARRAHILLQGNPYEPWAWHILATFKQGSGDLAGLMAARPYYANALYYSNYDPANIAAGVNARLWQALDGNKHEFETGTGPAQEQADMDLYVYCPLIRDLALAKLQCIQAGNTGECLGGLPDNERIMTIFLAANQRHPCPGLSMSYTNLTMAAPEEVDLSTP